MESILTIQSRDYTSRAGFSAIDEVMGNCATLYNTALQHIRDAWKQAGKSVSYYDQCRELTGLREDDPTGPPSLQVAHGVIMRAQRASDGFFRRCAATRYPAIRASSRAFVSEHWGYRSCLPRC